MSDSGEWVVDERYDLQQAAAEAASAADAVGKARAEAFGVDHSELALHVRLGQGHATLCLVLEAKHFNTVHLQMLG